MTVNEVLAELGLRTGDTQHTAVSRPDKTDLLSRAQQTINLIIGSVTARTTIQTVPRVAFYELSTAHPSIGRIIHAITTNGRHLYSATLQEISQYSRHWLAHIKPSITTFTNVGRDRLILQPLIENSTGVELAFTKVTTTLDDPTDTLELPDDEADLAVLLTETLLYIQTRKYDQATQTGQELTERLKGAIT